MFADLCRRWMELLRASWWPVTPLLVVQVLRGEAGLTTVLLSTSVVDEVDLRNGRGSCGRRSENGFDELGLRHPTACTGCCSLNRDRQRYIVGDF